MRASEEDKAFLAGVLDSKFRFYIFNAYRETPKKIYQTYFFAIEYGTIVPRIAVKINTITGHQFNIRINRYVFRMQAKNALNILRATKDYSHCRKEEIDIITKFFALKASLPEAGKQVAQFKLALLTSEKSKLPYSSTVINAWPESIRDAYLDGYTIANESGFNK